MWTGAEYTITYFGLMMFIPSRFLCYSVSIVTLRLVRLVTELLA